MPRVDGVRAMTTDYGAVAARLDEVTRRLQGILGL
jgi:hypothetical protein